MLPFDLHVLSMPPAFNLSQDQTLQFNSCAKSKPSVLLTSFFRQDTQFLFKVPTQFVFYLLNELCPEGMLRILRISNALSNTFFKKIKKNAFAPQIKLSAYYKYKFI